MSRIKVLHLAKWYPNKDEPLLGIFVRKQIQSLQSYCDQKVIGRVLSDNIHGNIVRLENDVNHIQEVVYYHKKGLLNKLRVMWEIWKEAKQFQSQITHAHVLGWTSILAYFLQIKNKTPFLASEHWSGYRNNHFHKKSFLSKVLIKKSAHKAQQIHVVSDFLKKDMLKCGIKANYRNIGNVVDGKALPLEKNKAFSFVFAGDLIQETKNVKGILEAFDALLQTHSNIRLDIIGDGKDLSNYKKLSGKLKLKGNISFHGNQSNDYVFNILSKSHALILNSYFETFSVICAEALLCGIPVISTRCGGPESFLTNETGILIDYDNTKELTEAMNSVIENYATYEPDKLKRIVKKFSSEVIGKKIHREYLNILNGDS
ncbi:MAG: glycosyltransferase [Flavobacteriales bacterium]|nr:glycosyltransferase [Flavobacteriales bacterium]